MARSISKFFPSLASLIVFLQNYSLPKCVSKTSLRHSFPCSEAPPSTLIEEIASIYSVNVSEIKSIIHGAKQNYLVSVPCTCRYLNGTNRYSYDTSSRVQPDDSFARVNNDRYSGEAYNVICKYLIHLHEAIILVPDVKFESDKPVMYSLEDMYEATKDFDDARRIGEGGYGSVYCSILGNQFFAELKVLCKIHHLNVVELLEYSTSDNHLYLVYEYVPNGSLNEHLHDPLLKARANIALDAARGIGYIHDHTKARYVHRDIKTSNILLDQGLRAKGMDNRFEHSLLSDVADFGLARLVERSNEQEVFAMRVLGTPGYIPPESFRKLRLTSKGDVYDFGVVLAEIVTGQCALARDDRDPNNFRTLVSTMITIFEGQKPQNALEAIIDCDLRESYPFEEVFKMADLAWRCLNDDAINRPEIKEIWEESLGGNDRVFSGLLNGR
ncbi:hypothetical protein ACJRO7_009397 [Eucalyptus globulus]|uniref:Protein kinase domain-containing protein n=1 Tax=Eucalyptus globulus TaxID=34317 RepID=A0ABD3L8M5_EUCGL